MTSLQEKLSPKMCKLESLKSEKKITTIKTKISTVSVQKETLKKAYLELEAKVDAAKVVYQSASDKFAQYDQQIVSITVEIERYQKQTSEL